VHDAVAKCQPVDGTHNGRGKMRAEDSDVSAGIWCDGIKADGPMKARWATIQVSSVFPTKETKQQNLPSPKKLRTLGPKGGIVKS
jgi:hypothetical protein